MLKIKMKSRDVVNVVSNVQKRSMDKASRYAKHLANFVGQQDNLHKSSQFVSGYGFTLVGILLVVQGLKLLIFGTLTNKEVKCLWQKVNYTIWEFFLSLLVVKFTQDSISASTVAKFASLFTCVLLLKCFHYLCVYRASCIFGNDLIDVYDEFETEDDYDGNFDDLCYNDINKNDSITQLYIKSNNNPYINIQSLRTSTLTHLRFAVGIVLLNFIDLTLIHRFYLEVTTSEESESNILLILFGFEILNLYPLIILTSCNYLSNFVKFNYKKSLMKKLIATQAHATDSVAEHIERLTSYENDYIIRKKKIMLIVKLLLTNLKLVNQFIFSVYFMQHFTFPIHILSHSYISIRISIFKLRSLIDLKRFESKIEYFEHNLMPGKCENAFVCSICREEKTTNVKSLKCGHKFHKVCIMNWLLKSGKCPMCHDEI